MYELERDEIGQYWQRIGPDTWRKIGGVIELPTPEPDPATELNYADMAMVFSGVFGSVVVRRHEEEPR